MTKDVIPRIAVNDSIKIGQEYMKVTTLSGDKKTLTVTRALAPESHVCHADLPRQRRMCV